MIREEIGPLLSELRERLELLYGSRLKGVYLFGSYARGEADEESDVDVLIVLDHLGNYSREIDATSQIASELSLQFGRSISRVFTTEQQWRTQHTAFFQNVREEAIPV
jgi:predicted nucleotidyltransferase